MSTDDHWGIMPTGSNFYIQWTQVKLPVLNTTVIMLESKGLYLPKLTLQEINKKLQDANVDCKYIFGIHILTRKLDIRMLNKRC